MFYEYLMIYELLYRYFFMNFNKIVSVAGQWTVQLQNRTFSMSFLKSKSRLFIANIEHYINFLRGIIFIVIVVITHTHIILASRWRFKMHIVIFS
jgi:hypothetical protein